VGYGFNGRNMGSVARLSGIPYTVIEMNPQTVKEERKKGEPIIYGDASQEAVLEQVNIKEARIVVIAISDPVAMRRITAAARNENPKALLIVRTRFVTEMKELYDLGADQVIPEEFETSIEIISRVLSRYLVPREEIERLVAKARADGYEMFRSPSKDVVSVSDLRVQLPDIDITTVRVGEQSPMAGKSLADTELRKKHGVSILAIRREQHVLSNPDPGTRIHPGDVLIVIGAPDALASCWRLMLTPNKENTHECDLPNSTHDAPAPQAELSEVQARVHRSDEKAKGNGSL
jgi:CPA2 family monovalent cation:H+ antiporter-2